MAAQIPAPTPADAPRPQAERPALAPPPPRLRMSWPRRAAGTAFVLAIAAIAGAFHILVFVSGSLYVAMIVHFVYDVIAGFTYARFARELGLLPSHAI